MPTASLTLLKPSPPAQRRRSAKKAWSHYATIAAGTALAAVSFNVLLLPFGISGGGVSGRGMNRRGAAHSRQRRQEGVVWRREPCFSCAVNAHFQPVELGRAYRLINHGPTVLVSSAHAGVENVMAASWACALDTAPPKVTLVVDSETKTRALIERSGEFVLQVPTVRQAALTHAVGSVSLADDPAKLAACGVELFHVDGRSVPLVAGCSAWLYCKVIDEPHVQSAYDLFLGEVVAAWADDRVFQNGRWNFEHADPEWRSLHHVAGGHFYAIGEPIHVGPK